MGAESSTHVQGDESTGDAGQDSDRDPRIAAGLSAIGLLIPLLAGAGHIYNGNIIRGVIFSVIQIINALLGFVFIGLVTYPLFGLYAIYDAYKGPGAPLYGMLPGED